MKLGQLFRWAEILVENRVNDVPKQLRHMFPDEQYNNILQATKAARTKVYEKSQRRKERDGK